MTTLPDLEPAALAKWLEGEAEHQEHIAARYKAASTSRQTYARRAEIFRASAAALAARSTVPEAGKAVDGMMLVPEKLAHNLYRFLSELSTAAISLRGFQGDITGHVHLYAEALKAALASVPAPSGAEPAEERGAKTEAALRRDGFFLTLSWRRHGKQFSARIYEPQGLLLSPALADVLVLALEEPRAPQAVPAEDVAGLVGRLVETAQHSRNPAPKQLSGEFWTELAIEVEEAAAALTILSAEREAAYQDISTKLQRALEERDALRLHLSRKTANVRDLAHRKTIAGEFRDDFKAKLAASEAEATSLRRKLEEHRETLAEAREHINRYADTAAEHDLVARIDALAAPLPEDAREDKP